MGVTMSSAVVNGKLPADFTGTRTLPSLFKILEGPFHII